LSFRFELFAGTHNRSHRDRNFSGSALLPWSEPRRRFGIVDSYSDALFLERTMHCD
jgi:hypothetical protein